MYSDVHASDIETRAGALSSNGSPSDDEPGLEQARRATQSGGRPTVQKRCCGRSLQAILRVARDSPGVGRTHVGGLPWLFTSAKGISQHLCGHSEVRSLKWALNVDDQVKPHGQAPRITTDDQRSRKPAACPCRLEPLVGRRVGLRPVRGKQRFLTPLFHLCFPELPIVASPRDEVAQRRTARRDIVFLCRERGLVFFLSAGIDTDDVGPAIAPKMVVGAARIAGG